MPEDNSVFLVLKYPSLSSWIWWSALDYKLLLNFEVVPSRTVKEGSPNSTKTVHLPCYFLASNREMQTLKYQYNWKKTTFMIWCWNQRCGAAVMRPNNILWNRTQQSMEEETITIRTLQLQLKYRPCRWSGFAVLTGTWWWSSERTEIELKTPHCNRPHSALVNLTLFSRRILYWTLPTLSREQHKSECVLSRTYATAISLST